MRLIACILLLLLYLGRSESEQEHYRRVVAEEAQKEFAEMQIRSDALLARFVDERKIATTMNTYISLYRWELPLEYIEKSVTSMKTRGWNVSLIRVYAAGHYYGRRCDDHVDVCEAELIDADSPPKRGEDSDYAYFLSFNRDGTIIRKLWYHCDCGLFYCTTDCQIDVIKISK